MTNELVKVINGTILVSSRNVAENFGKRHSDVIKSVEKHIDDLSSTEKSVQWFFESSYKDSSGKSCKEYLMNRDGFALLAMSFNNTRDVLEWKLKYIQAFNDMESQIKSLALPSYQLEDPIARAQRWIQEETIRQQQAQQIEQSKPKVNYFDTLVDHGNAVNFRDTAKLIGVKQKQLIDFLVTNGYLYRTKGKHSILLPYAKYNGNYFEMKEYATGDFSGKQSLVTVKGREMLLKKICEIKG